jgi:ATP-dependent helicase/DNAse subunit B
LENFVQSVNLFGDSQSFTSIELDQIVVTTIHQGNFFRCYKYLIKYFSAAKGREWPFVFIVRFNDGCIPLISSTSKDEKSEKEISQILEEERRLAFVGMSRPSKNLYISFSKCDYDGSPIIPSRFLSEIPDDLVQIAERAFDRTKMQSSKRLLESNDTESAIKKREI